MDRRDLLRGVAAGTGGALAGCLSGSPEDGDSDGDGDGDGDADADGGGGGPAAPPTVSGRSLESSGRCAEGDDRGTAAVAFGDAAVTVEGAVGTPDPCFTAAFEGVEYDPDADEVTVTVGVSDDGGICQQCLGVVEYDVRVAFDGGLPGSVRVRHATEEGTTAVTTARR